MSNDPRYRELVHLPQFDRHGHASVYVADEVAPHVVAWAEAISARGGALKINSAFRSVESQMPFWQKYSNWIHAGKPAPAVAAANKPGKSHHQGGGALDLETGGTFPNEPADKQVDLLWATGAPIGWTPIIAQPDENRSEHWHFDWWGPWRRVRDLYGYETACLCTALDVGQAGEWQSDARLVQALLLRAGYDVGEPDGIAGRRTNTALAALGLSLMNATATIAALRSLSPLEKWVVIK